jgi:predicted DNA-binding transcriptional regulator YafY
MLAKVRASLPRSLREKLDAMSAVYGTAAVPAKDFSGHAAIVDALTNAAIDKRSLRIRYDTLNTGKTRDRTVDPYAVYFDPDGATLKLIAYDHYREKILPFSVDHIRSVKQTNERFKRPADFDLREFLAENCFNGIHGDPVTVRLRAHGVTARVFAERTFHSSQRLIEHTPGTADRDESTTIEMRVASGRGLVRFILSWAPDVQVLLPRSLRDEVADAHRSAFLRSI